MENKKYIAPTIELIIIDNEISLALASDTPPERNDEDANLSPKYLQQDPFKTSFT
jgi:hypothetical protein